MNEDALDFGALESVNVSEVEVYSSEAMWGAVIGLMALFFILVSLTTWLGMRMGKEQPGEPVNRIQGWTPSIRVTAFLVFLSLLIVQALALTTVYIQTQIVHDSTWEYFQHLSWARLLGTSHAHVFGFAVTYGFIGFILSMTDVREWLKCVLISLILWGGMFDVLSWWGIKNYSADFEWISIVSGAVTGISSLVVFLLVGRSLLTPSSSSLKNAKDAVGP
jgi:hypothetical protein